MKKIAMLLGLCLLAGCATEPLTFTEVESGSTVVVDQGEQFTVSLYANQATGYMWELFAEPDGKVCKKVASQYTPDSTDKKLAGVGGREEMTFQAVGAGKTKMILHYRRNWEVNVPPAEVFELNVEVK